MDIDVKADGAATAHGAVDLERELELELAWNVEVQRLGEVHRAGLDAGTLAYLKERFRVGRTVERELAVLAAQRHEVEQHASAHSKSLYDLPNELIFLIMEDLEFDALASLSAVSRRFYIPLRNAVNWVIHSWTMAVNFVELFKAHPLFGAGIDTLEIAFEEWSLKGHFGLDAAQCGYIRQALELCSNLTDLTIESLPQALRDKTLLCKLSADADGYES